MVGAIFLISPHKAEKALSPCSSLSLCVLYCSSCVHICTAALGGVAQRAKNENKTKKKKIINKKTCCGSLCLSDPKICTLTPNGHLDLAPSPATVGLYPAERLAFTLGSRKSSVSSLGRAGLEQRPLVSVDYFPCWLGVHIPIGFGYSIGFDGK